MSASLAQGRWAPAVRARLEALLADPGVDRPAAVFDWDDTCIVGDIGCTVLDALDRATGSAHLATYDRLCAEQGIRVGYPYCTTALAGHTDAGLRAFVAATLAEALASGRIVEPPEMRQLVEALHAHGWEVWVVSASGRQLVETAAARYGIPASRVCAMTLAVGEDGALTDRLIPPITMLEGKQEAVAAALGRQAALAAGDATSDGPMLRAARHALVMSGASGPLGALAAAHGWMVQEPLR